MHRHGNGEAQRESNTRRALAAFNEENTSAQIAAFNREKQYLYAESHAHVHTPENPFSGPANETGTYKEPVIGPATGTRLHSIVKDALSPTRFFNR